MNEGPDVRGGLLEDVPLQLNLKGLKKEGVISGEEVEIIWTLKLKERDCFLDHF